MSKNNSVVPQARAALDQFKMEAARDVDVIFLRKINAKHNHDKHQKCCGNLKNFLLACHSLF